MPIDVMFENNLGSFQYFQSDSMKVLNFIYFTSGTVSSPLSKTLCIHLYHHILIDTFCLNVVYY